MFYLSLKQKMSTKYKASTTEEAFFITVTTVGWIDVFTRLNQKNNIINALNYCQQNKGLEIYAYCVMSSPTTTRILSCGCLFFLPKS